jgi:hypothetical protein
MRVTAFSVILFFVCLNLALFATHEAQVLPYSQEPYEDPGDVTIAGSGISYRFAASVTVLGVTAMVAILSKNTYIGLAGLAIWVADIFFPIMHWVLFGFPEFLAIFTASAGANAAQLYIITGMTTALMSLVWFWFILSFVSGRTVEQ